MNRPFVYGGQIPSTLNILGLATYALTAQAELAQDVLLSMLDPSSITSPTVVAGFKPSYSGNMTATFAAGRMYEADVVDATAFGDLTADARVIYHQARNDIETLSFSAAPGTAGYSRIDLVQVAREVVDDLSTVLMYFNSANPAVPYSGPSNTGTSQPQRRRQSAVLSIKEGTAGVTPVAPTPDAGNVSLFYMTIAYGETEVQASNISVADNAPFIGGLLRQHHTGDAGSAPKIEMSREVTGAYTADAQITTVASDADQSALVITIGTRPDTPTEGMFWSESDGFYGYIDGSLVGPFGASELSLGANVFTGIQTFVTPDTSGGSTIYPPGVAPTSPVDGETWGETTGLHMQIDGTDEEFATRSANSFTGKQTTTASVLGGAGWRLTPGVVPTTLVDGDMWNTTTATSVRRNGVTVNLADKAVVDLLNFYEVAIGSVGLPGASAVLAVLSATRSFTLAVSFANSRGRAMTAATAQTDFDVRKNNVSIGTIRFAAAGTIPTFISAAGGSFVAGDYLTVHAPASPDTTLANFGVTLVGVLV